MFTPGYSATRTRPQVEVTGHHPGIVKKQEVGRPD